MYLTISLLISQNRVRKLFDKKNYLTLGMKKYKHEKCARQKRHNDNSFSGAYGNLDFFHE